MIPRDHLTFYATLQRIVRDSTEARMVARAVRAAADAVRSTSPLAVEIQDAHIDLSALPAETRLEAAIAASLDARDPGTLVRTIFGRPLDGDVIEALRAGRLVEVLERIVERDRYASVLAGAGPAIESVTTRAAAVALAELPRAAGLISRGAVEVRAASAASQRAGNLITAATQESRFAVRELAVQSLQEGRDVYRAARSIRQVIGLNRQQAKSFDKFIQAAMDDDAHKSAAGVQQAIDREYNRLIGRRADTISRTELWQAGQDGQLEVWKEVADSGGLPIVGLDALFHSKIGEESRGPLLHVFCFCSQRLRKVRVNGRDVYVREWVVSVRNPCPRCLAFKGARALPKPTR